MTFKRLHRTLLLSTLALLTACFGASAQGRENVVSHTDSVAINFRQSKWNLDLNRGNNAAALDSIDRKLTTVLNDSIYRLRHVSIFGGASPEGSVAFNKFLSEHRAATLFGWFDKYGQLSDLDKTYTFYGRDWEGVLRLAEVDTNIPYRDETLALLRAIVDEKRALNGEEPPRSLERMKQLRGGEPYRYLYRNIFPAVRASKVIIDYEHIIAPDRIPTIPPFIPELNTAVVLTLPEIHPLPMQWPERKQRFFAIKTNLLGDVALCANLGFEVELWPHWSLDVPVWYSPYDITDRWRIRLLAVQPEVRYWLKDAGKGHYFGVHTTVAGFNVSFNGDWRYQDPNHAAFGLGVGYGYSFHLDKARRWGLEAQIGAGYISYKWIKYHNTGRNGAEYSRGGGTYWGITRAGLTLSYKFYADRKGRRWMKW